MMQYDDCAREELNNNAKPKTTRKQRREMPSKSTIEEVVARERERWGREQPASATPLFPQEERRKEKEGKKERKKERRGGRQAGRKEGRKREGGRGHSQTKGLARPPALLARLPTRSLARAPWGGESTVA